MGSNPAKTKLQNPNSKLQASNASPDGFSRLPSPSSNLQIANILAILKKWGIHTLGQLAALDKEELRARLGPEAVRLWERATGQSTRLLKFVQPPESFEESFEFENEIETAEPVFFMLRRFLEQLGLRLSGIYLVARELTLRIAFTDRQSYERVFKIPQPTNDVDLLFRMLQTHLENFKSKHPIVSVALTAQPIRPASEQFGLFETSLRNPHQLYETLARLTALLGADRVGTPVLEETHRPDAFRMEPFLWHELPAHPSGKMPMPPPSLRRFRAALPASVFISENTPAFLQSAKVSGKIADQRGPYFSSGNWWDEKSWGRAEWDLQLENDEVIRAHESAGTWKVDGIYD
jgi:impB/mucB/samB family C-terminal domain